MRRRDVLLCALATGSPTLAESAPRARSHRGARIGVLLPVPGNDHFLAALRDGLQDQGWSVDAIELEVRHADGTVEAFRRLGQELLALDVDVLVTASTAAASSLADLTNTTPIVFLGAFDPVAAGLVVSLDSPGRNLTGIAGFQPEIAASWVSLLQEIAPRVSRFVILSNHASISPAALAGWRGVASRNADVQELGVDTVADLDSAVAGVAADTVAGIIVVPHTFPFANRTALVAAMARHRVPAIYGIAEMVRSGGLISYGQDLGAQWRLSAVYIDQILRGAAPRDLPARYATNYALAINTTTAAALGLSVPRTLLDRADEVIGSQ
jgi:putative tryptophan/tyrosine transport system substrate-binding protein